MGAAALRPLPGPADDLTLLAEAHRSPRAREECVRRWLPLAHKLAGRYARRWDREDLDQVASLALLKAIDRFDTSRGNAFSSFALPTIEGELKRYLRDHSWAVRVPRGLQEFSLRVEATTEAMTRELGRSPTISELAERLDEDREAVVMALQAQDAKSAESLDTPGQLAAEPLEERLGASEDGYAQAEARVEAQRLVSALTDREREILRLRFVEDLTQAEIGARVGISQMQVSRILRRCLEELREQV